jgi:hypothetical protein
MMLVERPSNPSKFMIEELQKMKRAEWSPKVCFFIFLLQQENNFGCKGSKA